MSYPRDLDEYDVEELQTELERRAKLRKKSLCTYCERSIDTPACRFPERHSAKGKIKTPEIVVGDTSYELTQAFCEGAIAFHNSVPWNVGNPYHEDDDRHEEWSSGHEIAGTDKSDNGGVEFTKKQAEKALAAAKKRRL